MTNNLEYIDVDLTYDESDAQNFARIARLRDPNDVNNFFKVMKNVVKIFLDQLHDEQQEKLHDSRAELEKVSKVLSEAVSVLVNLSKNSRQIMTFRATIEDELSNDMFDPRAKTLTAELTLSSSNAASIYTLEDSNSSTSPAESHVLILQEHASKIVRTGDHLLEANIARIQQTKSWAASGLDSMRHKSKGRNFALKKAIIMLSFYYKLFTGRKATRSNRTDSLGRQCPYGPFTKLAEAVLERVLPEEWDHKGLDSVIREVLYPEEQKKRRKKQENKKKAITPANNPKIT
jgi:hypothetical protein